MTKIIFYSVFMVMLLTACSDNSNEKPYVRKPMDIVILKNAAWDGFTQTNETEILCRDFVLTEKDVKEFFMVAQEDTERDYLHSHVMSRCFADGELSLPRKFKGKWRIDKARRGILMVENAQTYFFYCDSCGSRKYAERE